MGVFAIWSFWRERDRDVSDVSGLKEIFQVFDQLVIFFSRSQEREEAAACLSEG